MRPSFNRCDIYAARPTERRGKKIAANEIKLWSKENGIPVFQPSKVGKEERLEIQAINPSYFSNGLWASFKPEIIRRSPKRRLEPAHVFAAEI